MLGIDVWLGGLPPLLIYVVVAAIILTESMGIPIPGELTLVSAALLAASGVTNIFGVATAAAVGAIIGDSIGYYIGHRGGRPLLERFGRRFPKHFGPPHLARAEKVFQRWGVWAVFFGRFVALLRIFAGPMAGMLRMHYPRFLAANAAGGIAWATTIGVVAYKIGDNADRIFGRVSVAALIAVGVAVVVLYVVRKVRKRRREQTEALDVAPAVESADV